MRQFVTTLLFLTIAAISRIAFADSSNEITVVKGNGNYPPFEMTTPDGKVTGIHIDMVNAVAETLKIGINYRSVPWKRALHMMAKGYADAIIHVGKNEEREKFAWFFHGNVISTVDNAFFVLRSRRGEFQYSGDFRQLQRYTIGMIRGYSYGEAFNQASRLQKDEGANNEQQLLAKLIYRRFDIGDRQQIDDSIFCKRKRNRGQDCFFRTLFYRYTSVYCIFKNQES